MVKLKNSTNLDLLIQKKKKQSQFSIAFSEELSIKIVFTPNRNRGRKLLATAGGPLATSGPASVPLFHTNAISLAPMLHSL